MKLEVGDYIRTKKGKIAKIISKEDVSSSLHRKEIVFILDIGDRLAIHSKKVTKSSKNIIDLIEVGDYVNGYKVIRIETSSYPEDKNAKIIVCCGDDDYYSYYNEEIKTILTKEQYENNCYRIEE